MIALTVVLVAAITGVMAFAPPPSDPSKPWIVRSWLFPSGTPSAHPRATPEQAATPVTPAPPSAGAPVPSQAPAGGTGSTKVMAQPPSPEAGSSRRTPIVLVSPPTPVGPPVNPQPARYTVQVGALRDQANADLLAEQLRAHGFSPIVSKDNLYRVRVGESLDRTAADQLAATLQAAGFDTYVRSY